MYPQVLEQCLAHRRSSITINQWWADEEIFGIGKKCTTRIHSKEAYVLFRTFSTLILLKEYLSNENLEIGSVRPGRSVGPSPSPTASDAWHTSAMSPLAVSSVLHCPLGACDLKRRLDPDSTVKSSVQPKLKLNIAF